MAILIQGFQSLHIVGQRFPVLYTPRFPILTHCGTRISSPLYTTVSNPYTLWDKDFQSCTLATPRFQFHVESVARIQASPHVRALAILLLEFRPVHMYVHWRFCCSNSGQSTCTYIGDSIARIQTGPRVRTLEILLLEFRPVHMHVHVHCRFFW